ADSACTSSMNSGLRREEFDDLNRRSLVGRHANLNLDGQAKTKQRKDLMSKHPFRVAIETGVSKEALGKLFAPDVVILAPMLTKPIKGARDMLNILDNAVRIASPIRYTLEISDSKQTLLFWTGNAEGHALQAVTIMKDGDDGLIHEIRVLMRPWP